MKQYIDKAAVVAEIERKIEAHKETLKNCDSSISEMVLKSSISAYQSLLYFLDTLEVKEEQSVDLANAAIEYCGGNKGSDARVRAAFVVGANWQEEQMIDKACEWLKEQDEMVGVSFEEDFIERFKNYMKGE